MLCMRVFTYGYRPVTYIKSLVLDRVVATEVDLCFVSRKIQRRSALELSAKPLGHVTVNADLNETTNVIAILFTMKKLNNEQHDYCAGLSSKLRNNSFDPAPTEAINRQV